MKKSTKIIILLFVMALVYSCGQKHLRFSDAEAEQLRERFDTCIAFNNLHRLDALNIIDTMMSVYEEIENTPKEVLTEKQQKMQRQIYLAKSGLYMYKGKMDSMLITLKDGLKDAETAHDTIAMTNAYMRLIGIYSSWRMEKQTRMFIHKALNVVDNVDNVRKLQCLLTLSMAFQEQNKIDSALIIINKADKVIASNDTLLKKFTTDVQYMYPYVKGWIYSTIPDSAEAAVKVLEPVYRTHAPKAYQTTGVDVISYSLGLAYEHLGHKAKAQEMFDKALDIIIKRNMLDGYDVAKRLMNRYLTEKDNARLLKILPVWYNMETTVYNNMSSSMLTEYEVEYRVAEQKHMIERQEWELKMKRLQNVILVCVVIILLLVCAWGAWFWQVRKRKMRKLFETIMFRYAEWHNMMLEVRNGETPLISVNAIGPNVLLGSQEKKQTVIMTGNTPPTANDNAETADGQTENNDNNFNKYHILYRKVLTVMEKEKPFVNPRLTIDGLARIVGTNRTDLSFCINSMSHCNFSHWIAIYRVNYLLELHMQDKSKPLDTFISEAGFSSRSSFYRQFKMVTGLTPAQFRNFANE